MELEFVIFKILSFRDIIDLMLGRLDAGRHGNNPNIRVAIRSDAMAELMLSQIVREVALKVRDEKISKQIYSTGRSMMKSAGPGLIAGWEDGDDTCPPYVHHHFPWPYPGPTPDPWITQVFDRVALNPQPLPPREISFAEQGWASREILLAEVLRLAASLTVSKEFNDQLKSSGLQLMKGAGSSKAYDDFENRCGSTGPRRPIPHGPGVKKEEFKTEFSEFA